MSFDDSDQKENEEKDNQAQNNASSDNNENEDDSKEQKKEDQQTEVNLNIVSENLESLSDKEDPNETETKQIEGEPDLQKINRKSLIKSKYKVFFISYITLLTSLLHQNLIVILSIFHIQLLELLMVGIT